MIFECILQLLGETLAMAMAVTMVELLIFTVTVLGLFKIDYVIALAERVFYFIEIVAAGGRVGG